MLSAMGRVRVREEQPSVNRSFRPFTVERNRSIEGNNHLLNHRADTIHAHLNTIKALQIQDVGGSGHESNLIDVSQLTERGISRRTQVVRDAMTAED
jgi:hypothetical protein